MADLTLLYDGACPLCCREVDMLRRRDQRHNGDQPRLAFVDIDAPDYDPAAHGGISYAAAMGRIHALAGQDPSTGGGDCEVLRDVAVFRRAYALVGLGWLYAPSGWPLLNSLADWAYGLWAAWRLRLTGRQPLEALCREREGRCRI
jgi:predicted DCC family thiol-disulfide oxidoreductase YuxK